MRVHDVFERLQRSSGGKQRFRALPRLTDIRDGRIPSDDLCGKADRLFAKIMRRPGVATKDLKNVADLQGGSDAAPDRSAAIGRHRLYDKSEFGTDELEQRSENFRGLAIR